MRQNPASLTFMIVDDEPARREVVAGLLERLGAKDVVLAEDGLHALDLLGPGARVPDVIFCDLDMPRMDGITLLRHLGERRLVAGVVLLSDPDPRLSGAAELLARSFGLYVLGVVDKPLDAAAIESIIADYDPDRTDMSGRQLEPITEAELIAGLEEGLLEVLYQPKVSTSGRRVTGVEALARWRHSTRGLLGPGAFVPLAEDLGHMPRLTDEVLHQSLPQVAAWSARGLRLDLAVNVSVEALHRRTFADEVPRLALEADLDVSRLILEITETRLMGHLTEPLEVAARLRLARVRLSVDDFGTGYASLEQLKRVPFTELKIDRAFVHGASADPTARAILESSVDLGRKLGLSLCAEGVQTRVDWDLVTALGCDEVQGYFVAKPMSPAEIPYWVTAWERAS